mmetsp:Transcript_41855/g.97462  ORF Transcript_41855/g.97462 Transcript_41855/m.97462 type:complete len:98 (-) Transcript_41855:493-786(-)
MFGEPMTRKSSQQPGQHQVHKPSCAALHAKNLKTFLQRIEEDPQNFQDKIEASRMICVPGARHVVDLRPCNIAQLGTVKEELQDRLWGTRAGCIVQL